MGEIVTRGWTTAPRNSWAYRTACDEDVLHINNVRFGIDLLWLVFSGSRMRVGRARLTENYDRVSRQHPLITGFTHTHTVTCIVHHRRHMNIIVGRGNNLNDENDDDIYIKRIWLDWDASRPVKTRPLC